MLIPPPSALAYDISYKFDWDMLSQARSRHGKRLEELAARTGRTKSYYAREALLEHLGVCRAYLI